MIDKTPRVKYTDYPRDCLKIRVSRGRSQHPNPPAEKHMVNPPEDFREGPFGVWRVFEKKNNTSREQKPDKHLLIKGSAEITLQRAITKSKPSRGKTHGEPSRRFQRKTLWRVFDQ